MIKTKNAALFLLVSVPLIAAAADKAHTPTVCTAIAPYKYRIAFTYLGGRRNPSETGSTSEISCLEREIKSEADWDWLQRRIEIDPKVTRVIIMSATPLSN